jgi:uncharacterized protein YxeA
MKKLLISLIAVALFFSLSTISFAKPKHHPAASIAKQSGTVTLKALTGKITLIDTTKNEVTIQDEKGVKTSFNVDTNQISSLKTDELINVTLKADGKTAETIKEVIKK